MTIVDPRQPQANQIESYQASQEDYRQQHKKRLSYMPWLYFSLKPKHRSWALAWQQQIQAKLSALETVILEDNCFIAPEARLFAEPGRTIKIGAGSSIAADSFIHGPLLVGCNVSINHHASFDGGKRGIIIGDNSRIGPYCSIYSFDHRTAPDRNINEQGVDSVGITIGQDVWLGARVGLVDGITIGDHAVIGMHSVVTQDIPAYAIAAGNPARIIGDRRDKGLKA